LLHSFLFCLIHVAQNLSHKVRIEDLLAVCNEFKSVYQFNKSGIRIRSPERCLFKVGEELSENVY
jgi:transposase-like protein